MQIFKNLWIDCSASESANIIEEIRGYLHLFSVPFLMLALWRLLPTSNERWAVATFSMPIFLIQEFLKLVLPFAVVNRLRKVRNLIVS